MFIPDTDSHVNTGVNGFEVGERVIISDDPFGKYVVIEITRAGRIKARHENGTVRSVTATVCMHPYKPERDRRK